MPAAEVDPPDVRVVLRHFNLRWHRERVSVRKFHHPHVRLHKTSRVAVVLVDLVVKTLIGRDIDKWDSAGGLVG